jgi:hypothetical protein
MGNLPTPEGGPREEPGQLFYPTEASHVFEKYWNHLPCLDQDPDFDSETPHCQQQMIKFSQALAEMDPDSFVPRSAAEAKESDLRIAEDLCFRECYRLKTGQTSGKSAGVAVAQDQVTPPPL